MNVLPHINPIMFTFLFFYLFFCCLLAMAFGLWVDLVAYSQRFLTCTLRLMTFSYLFKLMTWSILTGLRCCIRCAWWVEVVVFVRDTLFM